MYVTQELISEAERLYGVPAEKKITAPLSEDELDFISRTQRNGREHDITLLIFNASGEIAVMNKHGYPVGLYRPPSGGLDPGESFTDGAEREAREETGLEIKLSRYLLRVFVTFTSPSRTLPWVTHVFTATALTEAIQPEDLDEIREAKWAPMSIFDEFREKIKSFPRGGIQYRGNLHDAILEELKNRELL